MAATAAERWPQARTFHHSQFRAERIAAERAAERVGVPAGARMRRARSGRSSSSCSQLREAGAIDEVVVVDAASRGRHRGACAPPPARASARRPSCCPRTGPVLGKGDAMWRALSVLEGEVVCFLDADTEDFSAALRHGPDRAARVRARGVVREGLLPPPAGAEGALATPRAAAA